MTEGGKNYLLDELIIYFLINLYYINNSTNPNLSNLPLPTDKIENKNSINNLIIFGIVNIYLQIILVGVISINLERKC